MKTKLKKLLKIFSYVLICYAILTLITSVIFFLLGQAVNSNPLQDKTWLGAVAEICFIVNLPSLMIFDGSLLIKYIYKIFGYESIFIYMFPSLVYGLLGTGLFLFTKLPERKSRD